MMIVSPMKEENVGDKGWNVEPKTGEEEVDERRNRTTKTTGREEKQIGKTK